MKTWKKFLTAAGCAAVILAADYLLSNISFPLLDESESLNWFGYLNSQNTDLELEDVFIANTGIDKALVPIVDVYGDTIGQTPITDRRALLQLIDIATKASPRYILMDIRFEKGLESPYDSALFAKILSLPHLAISNHRDADGYTIADTALIAKSAMSDYRTNMFSGFSRYEYLQDGHESMALKAFRELYGTGVEQHGLIYTSDGHLSYNMQFLPLPVAASSTTTSDGEILYPYLSAQVLGMHTPEELIRMMKDKIVIIGDFDSDVHQTYVGSVPGPLLHYYALRQLEQGNHHVKFPCFAVLFAVYSFIFYFLISGYKISEKITSKLEIESPLALVLISTFGWTFVLSLIKMFLYYSIGFSFIASIPAFAFSAIELFQTWHKKHLEYKSREK